MKPSVFMVIQISRAAMNDRQMIGRQSFNDNFSAVTASSASCISLISAWLLRVRGLLAHGYPRIS
jgi:hypothetical protein